MTATTNETICKPWRSFDYSSSNPKSRRYAGPDLAPKLATHNLTGEKLGCPDW